MSLRCRRYDSSGSDSEDDENTPRVGRGAVRGKPSPLKHALNNALRATHPPFASRARGDPPALGTPVCDGGGGHAHDENDSPSPSPRSTGTGVSGGSGGGNTLSPYAHLSRLSKAGSLLPIPTWSPGLRGRTARNREVLLVARNAREQAKENEFLRGRMRELEEEIAEGSTRMERVKSALDAGERAVDASAESVRKLEGSLESAHKREVALRAGRVRYTQPAMTPTTNFAMTPTTF